MASKSQITLANRMLNLIKSAGTINKFELMDKAEISISTYNQLSGWFQHRFVNELKLIEYNKKEKTWIWRGTIKIEQ